MAWWKVILGLMVVAGLQADQKIMKDLTFGFGEAFEQCREESGLTEDKMEEFYHIWNDDFKFEHRELGCAVQCMSRHFNLLTNANRMHHENTENYIKSFPNGELIAKQLVEQIHLCEQKFEHEEDHCWRSLHVAECLRTKCHSSGMAPTVELFMAEFIMESEH